MGDVVSARGEAVASGLGTAAAIASFSLRSIPASAVGLEASLRARLPRNASTSGAATLSSVAAAALVTPEHPARLLDQLHVPRPNNDPSSLLPRPIIGAVTSPLNSPPTSLRRPPSFNGDFTMSNSELTNPGSSARLATPPSNA